jgi:hypothetical protein
LNGSAIIAWCYLKYCMFWQVKSMIRHLFSVSPLFDQLHIMVMKFCSSNINMSMCIICILYTADTYKGVSKSFWIESIMKSSTTTNTWEATQRVKVAKLTRLTHKIAIQLHIAAESSTICSYCSSWPVRESFDILSYVGEFHGTIPVGSTTVHPDHHI